jgi:hypothetical protein
MRRDSSWRAPGERGSALLIVFVFAAMVAIMLYAEMPVAVFEAKRQKEQLLINRGNEYAHGVKLFVRKFGMYPASVDQLENTNRMRFLRQRYKDPFTGKEDWRMLHAGPGGMLTDSKVTPPGGANLPGMGQGSSSSNSRSSSGFGTGSGFGTSPGFGTSSQTASASFGQTGFGSSSQNNASSATGVVVPEIPQRPPAISAGAGQAGAGGANGETGAAPVEGDQSPTAPLLTPGQTDQLASAGQNEAGAQAGTGQPGTGQPGTGQPGTGQATAGMVQPGQNGQAGPSGQPGQNATPGEPSAQSAMDTVRNMLTNRPQQLLAGSVPGQPMGQITSGGIAGVASVAHGHSIKTVNDQTDYSLWEFYYDPTKDTTRNMPGMPQGGTQQGANANGMNAGIQPQNSFGQNSTNQSMPNANSMLAPGPGSTSPATTNPQQ